MSVKSDIEIARAAKMLPIQEIGAKLDIPPEALIPYGHDKAKISADFIKANGRQQDGKLVLVTAVSPTPAGEGKTAVTRTSLPSCCLPLALMKSALIFALSWP